MSRLSKSGGPSEVTAGSPVLSEAKKKRRRRRRRVHSVKIEGVHMSVDDFQGDRYHRCVAWTLRELSSPFVMFDSEDVMVGGNFVAALDWAVFEQANPSYMLSILLRFRPEMCCEDFFTTLKVLFALRTQEAKSRQEIQEAQEAIGTVLGLWMTLKCSWQNVGPALFTEIVEWMTRQHLPIHAISKVQLGYVRSVALNHQRVALNATMKELHQTAMLGDKLMAMLQASNTTLDNLSPELIATNLTMLTWSYYVAMKPYELFRCAWQKSNKDTKAPNLCKLADLFNRVSFWVANEVIQHAQDGGISAAVAITVKFIDIAENLCALNNFNTLAAILAGLNLHSIARIKALWSELPAAEQDRLEELNELVSPQQNYKSYRSRISEVSGSPALPYIAVYLRDLTFIEDGNGSMVNYKSSPRQDGERSASDIDGEAEVDILDLIAPDSVLNVEKTFLLGCSMYNLLRYQQLAYDLPINPQVMSYVLVVKGVDEDTLYEKSVLVQPVGSDVATGVPTDERVLDEIPPTKWQPDEVGMWLRKIGLADLKQQFANVNGRSLLSMQNSDLYRLGVAKLGTRVRLMKAIKELGEWGDPLEEGGDLADPSKTRTLSNPTARHRPELSLSVGGASAMTGHSNRGEEGLPRRRSSSRRRALAGRASRSTGNLALTISGISSPVRSAKTRLEFLSTPPSSWTTSNCKRYIRLCPSLKCVLGRRLHRHSMRQLQVATSETLASWGISKEEDRQAVLHQFQAVQEEYRGLPLAEKHLADWTEEEVILFLAINGALEYEGIFSQRHIDGKLLARLGTDEMEVLGVKATHRLSLLASLRRHCKRVPS